MARLRVLGGVVLLLQSVSALAQSNTPAALDPPAATVVAPYLDMACTAYATCSHHSQLASHGFVREMNWQEAMRRAGVGDTIISLYERAGFSADVYRNDRLREIVIAYRGSDGGVPSALSGVGQDLVAKNLERLGLGPRDRFEGDWVTNFRARDLTSPAARLEAQYVAARSLASRIGGIYENTPYRSYSVSLTGHSLGGALASYAGQNVSTANVYTFDAARNVLAAGHPNSRQINIIASGDPVSDAQAAGGRIAGSFSQLPGRTYVVDVRGVSLQNHPVERLVDRVSSISATPRRPASGNAPALTALPAIQASPPARIGGISLSKAAADQMSLNIDLDGISFADGQLILTGRARNASFDAALLLTALRLACETSDPYFSLDPDDGAVWNEEGRKLAEVAFEKISADLKLNSASPGAWRQYKDGLSIKAITVRREYPALWAKLVPLHPNFRTRLVFRPEWLRSTRFGEILFLADILIKELAGGVPTLDGSTTLRAAKIDGYHSSDARKATRALIKLVDEGLQKKTAQWQGYRLWFDLIPQADEGSQHLTSDVNLQPRTRPALALHGVLRTRGYLEVADGKTAARSSLSVDGDAIDLSQVYPKMFVRRHDAALGRDLAGNDPALDALTDDVNRRPQIYIDAYKELRDLTYAFRAYVAAVRIAKGVPRLCRQLAGMPLLPTEKLAAPLPSHHPSELFMTVATFTWTNGNRRQRVSSTNTSNNGGIAVRARSLYASDALSVPTPITRELKQLPPTALAQATGLTRPGRHFIALRVDDLADTGPSAAAPPSRQDSRPLPATDIAKDPRLVCYGKSSADTCNANPECHWVYPKEAKGGNQYYSACYLRTDLTPNARR